ncbi:MAG: hypothetical protein LC798_10690 [Chloroflexi bacterium]|nr:hypothetical protein [Chloroflexota bacterium]
MRQQRIVFPVVRYRATKSLPCPVCGKKVRRRWTVEHTVNPYNRNADGTVRTPQQVQERARAVGQQWERRPEMCSRCASAALGVIG